MQYVLFGRGLEKEFFLVGRMHVSNLIHELCDKETEILYACDIYTISHANERSSL